MNSLQTSDYVRILWGRRWVVLLTALVCGLVAFGAAHIAAKSFVSTTELFVSAQAESTAQDLQSAGAFLSNNVTSYAAIARTPAVLEPAARALGLPAGSAALSPHVTATVPQNTVLVQISVSASSAEAAARQANAVGSSFAQVAPTLVPPAVGGRSPIRVTTLTPATPPAGPASPNIKLDTVLGVVLGVVLGCLVALARELLDTRVSKVEDLRRVTDVAVLASIPDLPKRAGFEAIYAGAGTAVSEPYRQLRTNLQFAETTRKARTIVIASAVAGEGKTTTSVNLALVLCQAGASVVLVDADLRRSHMGPSLGLSGKRGLTDILFAGATLDDAVQRWGLYELPVLVAGASRPDPSELLGSQAMDSLLAKLRQQFEWIIIDTPPLVPVTDAAILGAKSDAVLLVVARRVARLAQIRKAVDDLASVNAPVRGIVLNRLSTSARDRYTYYPIAEGVESVPDRVS